jgi:RNA polymerase sigma-70 factor (ECF subfamily)
MAGADEAFLEPARFKEFYERVLPVVYGYLWRRSGRREDVAMELTQETFLGVVRSLRSGVVVRDPLALVMSLARRRLVDYYRRSEVRRRVYPLFERDDVASAETSEAEARLLSALEAIPDHYRLVLILRYVDDLTVSETAELTGKSLAATESFLARARTALANRYEEQSDD